MNLVDDFKNVQTDELGYVLITEKEIADLRYSIIDDGGVERLIPLRWNSFHAYDETLMIFAALDSPIMGELEMTVFFDHFKRVTSVEIIDGFNDGHYAEWYMSSDMRTDLYEAVKVLVSRMYDTCAVRAWLPGTNPEELMESL